MPVDAILIVEDHTMIAEYLASVLAGAGYEPIQAGDLAAAKGLLQQRDFGLWLCDRHLPDGLGSDLLRERIGVHAQTPAIAISAELDSGLEQTLLDQGFAETLTKPCPPDTLLAAVRRQLGPRQTVLPPTEADRLPETPRVLDDSAAMRVCGSAETMRAMRRLLATELARTRPQLQSAWQTGDTPSLVAELHKLAAAAAWCGADETGQASAALRSALNDPSISASEAWTTLLSALDRLQAALAEASAE